MSNKLNIEKTGGFSAVRAAGQSEPKKTAAEPGGVLGAPKNADSDKLLLSDRGTEVGIFVEDLKNAPDLRQEQVTALRSQIENGEYNPSSEQIAAAIDRDESLQRSS